MRGLSPGTRRALQVFGVLFLLAGIVLFGLTAVSMMSGDPDFGALALMGFGSIFLLAVGGFMAQWGFLRAISRVGAAETGDAVEYVAGRVGRGLRGGTEVRVRCRACGALDSEDAKFCSSCGGAL